MHKNFIALAATLLAAGAASAQSVSLYGVVDASFEHVKGTDGVTRISSDNYASSRLGFKGTEDLGDGLKARFVLEHGLKVDNGAQNNGARFWDRAAWVGLEGAFGDLKLGRIDSAIGLLAGNTAILGAQGYDDFKIARTFAGDTYRRVDNAITYTLPTLTPGLTLQAQYTLAAGTSSTPGAETADSDLGKGFSLSGQYVMGPLALGAAYIEIEANAAGSYEDSAALAYASYDFGMARLTGYYNVDSRSGAAEQKKLLGAKVWVPVSADLSFQAGLSQVQNAAKSSVDDDALILALKVNYSLSKRTSVYGLFTSVDNEDGSSLGVTNIATPAGDTSTGLAVGIRHAF